MNFEYKKAVKDCVKIIAFLLAFLLVLEGLSLSVLSGRNAAKFSSKLRDAYSFVDEPKDTIQIACVGNSNMYSGFVPFTLWDEYGYTATVCASPKQSVTQSLGLIEKVYENQTPDLVLVETDMFYDNYPQTDRKRGSLRSSKLSLSSVIDSAKPDYFEDGVRNVFSAFVFHNRWKKAAVHNEGSFIQAHGYRYSKTVYTIKAVNYMLTSTDSEDIAKKRISEIDKLVSYCRKKGSTVVFVTMPSVNGWDSERHNAVAAYAKKNGIDYIDLNNNYGEVGIDMQNAFRDAGTHLNYDSAKKVTVYLGSLIKKTGLLESRTDNPKYSYWTQDSENFKKSI